MSKLKPEYRRFVTLFLRKTKGFLFVNAKRGHF